MLTSAVISMLLLMVVVAVASAPYPGGNSFVKGCANFKGTTIYKSGATLIDDPDGGNTPCVGGILTWRNSDGSEESAADSCTSEFFLDEWWLDSLGNVRDELYGCRYGCRDGLAGSYCRTP